MEHDIAKRGPTLGTKIKIGLILLAAVLLVVLIAMNCHAVRARLLAWEVHPPLAVLLLMTLGLGFVVGLIVSIRLYGREKKPRS